MDNSWMRQDTVNILRYLPEYLAKDTDFKAVNDADSKEHERIRLALQDLSKQFFVKFATWGLDDWEKLCGIDVDYNNSLGYERRRARIIAQLMGTGAMTPERVTALINLFVSPQGATFTPHYDRYTIGVNIPWNSQAYLKDLHEALDKYLPAHIAYYCVARTERQLFWNAAGPVVTTEITPERRWTETIEYKTFEAGLNSAGEAENYQESYKEILHHSGYEFKQGLLNRMSLNSGGNFSRTAMDMGEDVTDNWDIFCGDVLNGRVSPRTEDGRKKQLSRTYHVADWREVIGYHGQGMNSVRKEQLTWTTEETHEESGRRFKKPRFMLNGYGKMSVTREDVGEDIEVIDILFRGGMNSNVHEEITSTSEKIIYRNDSLFVASRLNQKSEKMRLNESQRQRRQRETTVTETTTRKVFKGAVMNGHQLRMNTGARESTSRTIHVEKWRDVLHYAGGSLLNRAKLATKTVEIEHVVPAVYGKKFNPAVGALLNNHAVMGYLRL